MASKLDIWNRALRALRKPPVASLTDNVATRYRLTEAWDQAVAECAEAGMWNFGMVTASLSYDSGVTPIPGFTYGFTKPAAWVRTIAVSGGSLFETGADYRDEDGKLFANFTPIYIRYLSSAKFADGYVTTWPASFVAVVASRIALELAEILGESTEMKLSLEKAFEDAMRRAKNLDAMNQPALKFRSGSWVRSMRGSSIEGLSGGGGSTSGSSGADVTLYETGDV